MMGVWKMGSRRGGKQRTKKNTFGDNGNYQYFQSASYNNRLYNYYIDIITKMAMVRFRWINLPKTCDERYLEWNLIHNGMATIAFPPKMRGMFLSLQCNGNGRPNMYDYPQSWVALGSDGTSFQCSAKNGVIVYDNVSRYPLMNGIMLYANELTHVRITKRMNRMHQQIPFILTGPQEKRQDMANMFKQVAGGEPAILAYDDFNSMQYNALSTGVKYIGEDLAQDEANVWNRVYAMLGIENATFKQERQTEDEIRAQQSPTQLVYMGSLLERRKAADRLNMMFGQYLDEPIKVVWRQDNESENWNMYHNVASQLKAME